MTSTRFKTGGPLSDEDSLVYIEREADYEAFRCLEDMQYLLLIEPRQQGKTSLLAWLHRQYDLPDCLFAYVDIENLTYQSEEAWFAHFWQKLKVGMGDIDLAQEAPTNCKEWEVCLAQMASFATDHSFRIFIALDEIGRMAKCAWAEQFFTLLRSIYNQRVFHWPMYRHVTFILAGAFNPRHLIKDDKISPFNIAIRVRLSDFTLEQVYELVSKGAWSPTQAVVLAERIHYWTDGQPYLTQLLCSYLPTEATAADVDAGVEKLLRDDESNLPPIFQRLNRDAKLLNYVRRKVWSGQKTKFYPKGDDRYQSPLELIGIIKGDENGYCRIRNRIYEKVLEQFVKPITEVEMRQMASLQRRLDEKKRHLLTLEDRAASYIDQRRVPLDWRVIETSIRRDIEKLKSQLKELGVE